jgi:hypothetical protein
MVADDEESDLEHIVELKTLKKLSHPLIQEVHEAYVSQSK